MCGINGFIGSDEGLIKKINEITKHRGPDDSNFYVDQDISLGHNRLSIIDLSPDGRQPMNDGSDDLKIVYNGEIYNFIEIKKELESEYKFNSKSDTEVILAAYKKWGSKCLEKFNGMFAFAIWSTKTKELFLARDRAGIKPLYYYHKNNQFIFSSEIKAILETGIKRRVDKEALYDYFQLLYVPGPKTLFEDIYSLPAGHYAIYKEGQLEINNYWDGYNTNLNYKSFSKEEFKKIIEDSIHNQLISDREVGIYLSGGIDSSILLSSVIKKNKSVKTFSIGFELREDEESEKFNKDFELAKRTAKYFGSNHFEIKVKPQDILDNLEDIVWHMDQPIVNATSISMFMLSKLAKPEVATVLSGDGGDELFGGYDRYFLANRADLIVKSSPEFLLNILNKKHFKKSEIERYLAFTLQNQEVLEEILNIDQSFDKTKDKIIKIFNDQNPKRSFVEKFMIADSKIWLVDQALMLSDRMSMAHGLEQRVPFLDNDIIDLSIFLEKNKKVSLFDKKVFLKEAFRDQLPDYLFNEPKRGWFSPGAKWLRRPEVLEYFKKILSKDYCKTFEGVIDWSKVEEIIDSHVKGERYNMHIIWALSMLQIWAKRFEVSLNLDSTLD